MRDVARVAGVSLATVSRVINASQDVHPELARRVTEAIELLGYRRDLTASALRRADKRSRSIGVIVEDVGNPFLSALQRGVEDVARRREVIALVASSDDVADRERDLAAAFVSRGVDGLIIVPCAASQSYLERDRDSGIAVVFVDRPPHGLEADTVVADNFGGAETAVEHLLAQGHERIAFMGDRRSVYTTQERLRGYQHALLRHAIVAAACDERLDLASSDASAAAVDDLLDRADPPTALFAGQNLLTIGAVRALRRLGLEHDVALVGFDDVPLAPGLRPGVTVVAQDPRAIGRQAAELLFSRIDGHTGPPRHVVVAVKLIARGSGEISPAARNGKAL
jgi:LacI family transcriptional regulator